MNETQAEKEEQFWRGYEICKARGDDNKRPVFVKGCPYFKVKRESLRIVETVA